MGGQPERIAPEAAAIQTRIMARFVRNMRLRQGRSQEWLAQRAGVSRISVLKTENGSQVPRVDTLAAMLEALGYQMTCVPLEAPTTAALAGVPAGGESGNGR